MYDYFAPVDTDGDKYYEVLITYLHIDNKQISKVK